MLRKIRVTLGILFLALITLLFLDFTGVLHGWFGWMAKIQLVPAILATNFIIVVLLAVFTLVFGRVYCSVICPLGLFQDAVSRIAGRFRRKNRFTYSPARSWLRWGVLAVFIVALTAHVSVVVVLLEPYSAFGRIALELFAPLYRWGNNLLAFFAEKAGGYAFYPVEVRIKAGVTLGTAVATFLAVGYLAWRNGRTWCNTVCPVGTLLGFLSKYSVMRPVIDPDKCTKCSLCSKNCKASCIDYKNFAIDHTRCVTCMNCLDKCKFDALHYTAKRPERAVWSVPEAGTENGDGMSRRSFLAVTGLVAVANTIKAQAPIADGGLAVIEDKKIPMRETRVLPPGAESAHNMEVHCTACQLCVSVCPNDILRPSNKLSTFMKPEMSYELGYCRPECVRCSEVCPNGAIKRITPAEKSAVQIGRAVWISENCVVNRDEVPCTACEGQCPTGAIMLIQRGGEGSLKTPAVDTELCIGCGACEYVCPSRPFSAIYVEGILKHRIV